MFWSGNDLEMTVHSWVVLLKKGESGMKQQNKKVFWFLTHSHLLVLVLIMCVHKDNKHPLFYVPPSFENPGSTTAILT